MPLVITTVKEAQNAIYAFLFIQKDKISPIIPIQSGTDKTYEYGKLFHARLDLATILSIID